MKSELDKEEQAHTLTIQQRDHAEFMADALAAAIAKHLDIEIGEHSSEHCPWQCALEHIESHTT